MFVERLDLYQEIPEQPTRYEDHFPTKAARPDWLGLGALGFLILLIAL